MRRPRLVYLLSGSFLLLLILVAVVFAPQLTRVSPDYWDAKPSVIMGLPPFPPGPGHLLGTDQCGRDVWSRLLYGARWSMLFACLITVGRLLVAAPAALLGAFGPRRLGWLVDRCYVVTNAVPPLLIYVLILSAPQLRLIGLGPSAALTVLLLTLLEWPRIAVVLKARVEGLLTESFVEGAVAAGATRWQLFRNHLFPHLWPILLQLISTEMARALAMIAQMAVFGVLIGGGVANIGFRGEYVLTTGIPEWGSLLSDGRVYILSKPWIPLPAAFAFLIGVGGFNLFAQGLEMLLVSVQSLKDATTARLSRRWRWAWALAVAGAVLWYCQGLPWDREAGIADLALRQTEALSAHDLAAYKATLAPRDWGWDPDLARWAASLVATEYQRVSVTHRTHEMHGSHATVTWEIRVDYRDKPPTRQEVRADLVRRFGRWYATGEPYNRLRGYDVDVVAKFDPIGPTINDLPVRRRVEDLATAADHAFAAVAPVFPAQPGAPRPLIKLYPTPAAYDQAMGQAGTGVISYVAGEAIRVSPDFLMSTQRWDIERSLAFEMIKYLTKTRLGRDRPDPVLVGGYDLNINTQGSTYRIDVSRLSGQPLLTLPELYAVSLDELPEAKVQSYVVQSALLTEFVRSRLNSRTIDAAGPAELAAQLGLAPGDLATQYWNYMLERIFSESLLAVPAARGRIPDGLAEAIEKRAAAAMGDEAAFLSALEPAHQVEHSAWLTLVRSAGLTGYRARLLDVQGDGAQANVLVLEELTFADGRTVAGVVSQVWLQSPAGQWLAGPVASLVR